MQRTDIQMGTRQALSAMNSQIAPSFFMEDLSMSVMQGYDREKAVAYMSQRLDPSEFKPVADHVKELLNAAIDADFAYMTEAGVLNAEGLMGDAYYDDDDAFEYILERVSSPLSPSEKQMRALSSFVNQFMELQEAFMTEADLIDWN